MFLFLEQNILFGYGSSGLLSFNNGKPEGVLKYLFETDSRDNPVMFNKLDKISDGSYLASTSKGFYRIENTKFKKLNIGGFLTKRFTVCLRAKTEIYMQEAQAKFI